MGLITETAYQYYNTSEKFTTTANQTAFTLTFSTSTGGSVIPTTGKQDFILHDSDRVQLILGILKYAGLVIADPTIIQAASGEENKTIQLENS